MKKFIPYYLSVSLLLAVSLMPLSTIQAQGTETFEALLPVGSTSFTNAGFTFSTGTTNFKTDFLLNGGTGPSDHYLDNIADLGTGKTVIQLEINTYRNTNYTIVAEGISMQGATAFLYDSFTNIYTEIPQSGLVNYDYIVDLNNAGSYAINRFTIVFTAEALSVSAYDIEGILLYPNPTNIGKFYLNVPLGMDDLEVTIYDVLGAKLYNETGISGGRRVTINIDSKISMGTYFVELNSQGRTVTKKLIIN